jgi:hypothetical protein
MRPGPAPKNAAQRVRRNATGVPARGTLPAAGYAGPVPAWPLRECPQTDAERERWAELWRCPQAAAWAGLALEYGLAAMVQLEQRCQRPRTSAQHLGELRHMRAEFGLSLDGMAKLGLTIEHNTAGAADEQSAHPVRRLKAVDTDAS